MGQKWPPLKLKDEEPTIGLCLMFSILDIHVPHIHLFVYKNKKKAATYTIGHVILKFQEQSAEWREQY